MTGSARKRPATKATFRCIQKASPGAVKIREEFLIFEGTKDTKGDFIIKPISNFIGNISALKRSSE
jgi:hypothetical protein